MFFFVTERAFEDHECLVEHLSTWSRDTENQLLFLRRSDKYAVFREPQVSVSGRENDTDRMDNEVTHAQYNRLDLISSH